MWEALNKARERYAELGRLLSDEKVVSKPRLLREYSKEMSDLEDLVKKADEYEEAARGIAEAEEIIKTSDDQELVDLARQEIEGLRDSHEAIEQELQAMLIPRDPNDEKNTLVEIRAGTGGEEAALFAADLYRMYSKYAEEKGWGTDIMSSNPTGVGGFKEIVFLVEGKGAYSRLKFESGVHRVQRVPATESSGRIHTSAVTVAILPEAGEVDVDIKPDEIRVDVFRSSGPGGQSVNTTDSAVRITHIPTGIVVQCQDEKSQHKNRAKALKVLRSRLYEMARVEQERERARERKQMVGTGDRSEKIRTYNYPQGRVTDHRINLTLHKLDDVLDGDIDEIVNALWAHDTREKIKSSGM
ncbi:MAG: peptide chain release factor 1 [bacterium]|jgi:peptide chain release factor 1